MTSASRSTGWAIAVLLAGVIGALWWVMSPPTVEGSRAWSDNAPPAAEPSEEPDAPAIGEDDGSTDIDLLVTGDDGKPASGVRWVAYTSVIDDEPLATGVTKFRGKSAFQVPRDTGGVYIETLRTRRRAPALTALPFDGEHRITAEIRVGRGGAITGRVIDDTGEPVVGLEIDLVATVAQVLAGVAEEGVGIPVAVTAADGSFAVGQLASLAEELVSRSNLTWQTLRPVGLSFGACVHATQFHYKPRYFVLGDETVDIGDVVVPRPATYAGRVVDADGVAVEGALVSTHPRRLRAIDSSSVPRPGTALRVRPGAEGFALLENEVLTDADGSFVVEPRDPEKVLVWTRVGVRKRLALPYVRPGARADDLVWSVGRDEVLEVVLVDAEGRRVVEPEQIFGWGDTEPTGVRYERSWGARFQLERRGGEHRLMALVADADGVFRVPLVFPRVHLERLRVFLTGWLPAVVLESELPPDDKRIELTIDPFPEVRLSVRVPAQDLRTVSLPTNRYGSPGEESIVDVAICKLDPLQRAAARASQEGSSWSRFTPCCGSGSSFANWAGVEEGKTFELDMPVQEPGEYWVYVSDLPGRPADLELAFGPYTPSDVRHTLAVSPLPEVTSEDSDLRDEDLRNKPSEEPEPDLVYVTVHGRVVDAESGAPLPDVRVGTSGYRSSFYSGDMTDSAGRFFLRLPAGVSEPLRFDELGYENMDLTASAPESAGELNLGDIRLAPEPTVRGYLVRSDGPPVEARGTLLIPGHKPFWGTRLDEEGGFDTSADLHAGQSIWLRMHFARDGRRVDGLQRIVIEQWHPDRVNEVEVALWRDVEIRLEGFAGNTLHSEAFVRVEPVLSEADDPAEPTPFMYAHARESAIPSRDGVRTFRVVLGPGRYRVQVEQSPVPFGETELVVHDRPGLQVLECIRR